MASTRDNVDQGYAAHHPNHLFYGMHELEFEHDLYQNPDKANFFVKIHNDGSSGRANKGYFSDGNDSSSDIYEQQEKKKSKEIEQQALRMNMRMVCELSAEMQTSYQQMMATPTSYETYDRVGKNGLTYTYSDGELLYVSDGYSCLYDDGGATINDVMGYDDYPSLNGADGFMLSTSFTDEELSSDFLLDTLNVETLGVDEVEFNQMIDFQSPLSASQEQAFAFTNDDLASIDVTDPDMDTATTKIETQVDNNFTAAPAYSDFSSNAASITSSASMFDGSANVDLGLMDTSSQLDVDPSKLEVTTGSSPAPAAPAAPSL